MSSFSIIKADYLVLNFKNKVYLVIPTKTTLYNDSLVNYNESVFIHVILLIN